MNTAILLGAGSSLAASFPSTKDLTDLILSGNGVTRGSDSSYYIDDDGPPYEATRLANCVVRRLHAEAKLYYSTYAERRANYEDLFYLAQQASDDLSGELENPAVRSFVNELRTYTSQLIEASKNSYEHQLHVVDGPEELLRETSNYIADIVWRRLCHEPKPESLSQLGIIAHACKSVDYRVTSISTLCHDTHVETFLKKKGISLADGFDAEPQAGVRYWNGDFSSSGTTPFLKLHGSVNWFRFRPDSGDFYDERIGIPLGDYRHTQTDDGNLQLPVDGRPLLLIGTFNKISEYSSGIFRELHHRFRSTTMEANQIVVCGYGFGDKGINTEIIEWCFGKRERRLVIIHPNPDCLICNARRAIRKNWPVWKKNGSISIINKRFQDVGIEEFAAETFHRA